MSRIKSTPLKPLLILTLRRSSHSCVELQQPAYGSTPCLLNTFFTATRSLCHINTMSSGESDNDSVFLDGSDEFSHRGATSGSTISSLKSLNPTPDLSANNAVSNASDQYQRLSQLEHILKRPDTYIGSVERTDIKMWCFDATSESMQFKEVNFVPGLYKIFDEILVNAADNKIRDPTMRTIRVKIDREVGAIEVMNDGKGIPVEIHSKEKIYIPELIFGNLLTSSNYDDNDKKVTGGRNGFGAKLCNIFSTEFSLETADLSTGQLYRQTWHNNMLQVSKPKITKLKSKKEYTKITFKPDLAKFNMESLDDDIISILQRRVYDLCGTVTNCNIYLNDQKLNVRNFKSYVEMYVKALRNESDSPSEGTPTDIDPTAKKLTVIVHEMLNARWEVAFAVSNGTFNQVSFVNSIATTSGGSHVKYVSDQIVQKLTDELSKKVKGKSAMIKKQEVKNNMFIFINCLIENPAFTSQTKEQLTTTVAKFGGKANEKAIIPDEFIKKILKTDIGEKLRNIISSNEDKALQKNDGSRKSRVKNVKLVDANKAGTKDGNKCTLILTEGDSALSLAVAGLAVIGRDYYGAFPLRGKMLNVREATADQIAKNAEICALKQIMGLQHRKSYDIENIKTLRYGHIMIMTDQDQDGSHIKGLIINFLETSFPGLLEIPGFLLEFITPIIKVTIKKRGGKAEKIPFYNLPEFEKWRENEGASLSWTHKYYKGLGTSDATEAREYFAALMKHQKMFHALQKEDEGLIDLAFSKKKADDRKEWLRGFQPGTHLDPNLTEIPISDFINKELILFLMADNVRSIPSMLDGFKPGQRKVLFAMFKRNSKSDVKVAQLAGYVGEHTEYHHGEASLFLTIVGMAQNYVGSNNLNLLKPNGAFGTRAAGGKDVSAARYIYTELSAITKHVFNPLDNGSYTYVQEDSKYVEPQWYLPVLPMILVNGAEGIGTGWSTNIPCFNPVDIVENIQRMMRGDPCESMHPWYRGWDGDMDGGPGKYRVMGRIEQVDETTLAITELPIKVWTNNVKEFLLAGLGSEKGAAWIRDVEEQHGVSIRFIVKLLSEEMAKTYKIGLLERFKLISSISMSNMVAFDPMGRIKKYESPVEILQDYYYVRLEFYQKRKDLMAQDMQNYLHKLLEQARFIKLIIDKELSVSNKKRSELVGSLQELGFMRFDKQGRPVIETATPQLFIEAEEAMAEEEDEAGDVSFLNASAPATADDEEHRPETVYAYYDYLLGMSIWALTKERYEKLLKQKGQQEQELSTLLSKSAKDLWSADLDVFTVEWAKFLKADEEERLSMIPEKGTKATSKRKRTAKKETGASTSKKPKIESTDPANESSKRETDNAAKPKPNAKPKAKGNLPASIKQEKKPNDVLAFFNQHGNQDNQVKSGILKPKSATSSPVVMTPSTPRENAVSVFSDSDDDILLGVSANNKKPLTIKKAKSSKSRVQDELKDLETSLPVASEIPPRGDRARNSAKSYRIIDDDESESDEDLKGPPSSDDEVEMSVELVESDEFSD